jgi:hypothetical protein
MSHDVQRSNLSKSSCYQRHLIPDWLPDVTRIWMLVPPYWIPAVRGKPGSSSFQGSANGWASFSCNVNRVCLAYRQRLLILVRNFSGKIFDGPTIVVLTSVSSADTQQIRINQVARAEREQDEESTQSKEHILICRFSANPVKASTIWPRSTLLQRERHGANCMSSPTAE